MMENERRVTETPRPVRYRVAKSRDSLAMWRLRRTRVQDESISPFFYMSVLERLSESCVVAESGGEVIGYVIARRADERASVRVFDLTVDPAFDTAFVAAGMLGRLIKLPGHSRVKFIDAEVDAHHAVGRLLSLVGSTNMTGRIGTALAADPIHMAHRARRSMAPGMEEAWQA